MRRSFDFMVLRILVELRVCFLRVKGAASPYPIINARSTTPHGSHAPGGKQRDPKKLLKVCDTRKQESERHECLSTSQGWRIAISGHFNISILFSYAAVFQQGMRCEVNFHVIGNFYVICVKLGRGSTLPL